VSSWLFTSDLTRSLHRL